MNDDRFFDWLKQLGVGFTLKIVRTPASRDYDLTLYGKGIDLRFQTNDWQRLEELAIKAVSLAEGVSLPGWVSR